MENVLRSVGLMAAKETRVVVLIKWITRDHNNLINTLTDLYPDTPRACFPPSVGHNYILSLVGWVRISRLRHP